MNVNELRFLQAPLHCDLWTAVQAQLSLSIGDCFNYTIWDVSSKQLLSFEVLRFNKSHQSEWIDGSVSIGQFKHNGSRQ